MASPPILILKQQMSRLLDKTTQLIRDSKLSAREIAIATGLSPSMVQKLTCAKPSVPNVEACEKIYNLLSGKELEL